MRVSAVLTVATAVLLASCGGDDSEPPPEIDVAQTVDVTSDAFVQGDTMPTKYTCDGDNVSPPLHWVAPPDSEGYVVTLTDPDAPGGTFTHWIVHGIPATVTSLEEGSVPDEAVQGENDFPEVGYGGPCPPEGDDPHRYVFTVYSIEGEPGSGLVEGASLDEVLEAIQCCVSAEGTLTTTFGR